MLSSHPSEGQIPDSASEAKLPKIIIYFDTSLDQRLPYHVRHRAHVFFLWVDMFRLSSHF